MGLKTIGADMGLLDLIPNTTINSYLTSLHPEIVITHYVK